MSKAIMCVMKENAVDPMNEETDEVERVSAGICKPYDQSHPQPRWLKNRSQASIKTCLRSIGVFSGISSPGWTTLERGLSLFKGFHRNVQVMARIASTVSASL